MEEKYGSHLGFDYCVKYVESFGAWYWCGFVKLVGEKLLEQDCFLTGEDDVGIVCHGGITFDQTNVDYAPSRPGRWIGFHCAHPGDDPEECNESFAENECLNIISQLWCWLHGIPDAADLDEEAKSESAEEPSTEELKEEISNLLVDLRELKDILAAKLTGEKFKDFDPEA